MTESDTPRAADRLDELREHLGTKRAEWVAGRAEQIRSTLRGFDVETLSMMRGLLDDPFERFHVEHAERFAQIETRLGEARIRYRHATAQGAAAEKALKQAGPTQDTMAHTTAAWNVAEGARTEIAGLEAEASRMRMLRLDPGSWLQRHGERAAHALAFEQAAGVLRMMPPPVQEPRSRDVWEERVAPLLGGHRELLGEERSARLIEQAGAIYGTLQHADDATLIELRAELDGALAPIDPARAQQTHALEDRRRQHEQRARLHDLQANVLTRAEYRLGRAAALRATADRERDQAVEVIDQENALRASGMHLDGWTTAHGAPTAMSLAVEATVADRGLDRARDDIDRAAPVARDRTGSWSQEQPSQAIQPEATSAVLDHDGQEQPGRDAGDDGFGM